MNCTTLAQNLGDVQINLGQYKLTIPPEGYLLNNTLDYECFVAISSSGSNQQPYILGDTFIRNFYSSFDYKHKKVSLAVSANAPAGVSVERDFTTLVTVCIILSVVLGVLVLWICAKAYLRRRKERKARLGGSVDGPSSFYEYSQQRQQSESLVYNSENI